MPKLDRTTETSKIINNNFNGVSIPKKRKAAGL